MVHTKIYTVNTPLLIYNYALNLFEDSKLLSYLY